MEEKPINVLMVDEGREAPEPLAPPAISPAPQSLPPLVIPAETLLEP